VQLVKLIPNMSNYFKLNFKYENLKVKTLVKLLSNMSNNFSINFKYENSTHTIKNN